MKYIKELKDEYPLNFFGRSPDGQLPQDGMLYFVERRWRDLAWMPVIDHEVYMVRNGKWVRGKREEPINEENITEDIYPDQDGDRLQKALEKLHAIE